MQTDLPLKQLMLLRAQELLPLLGAPGMEVVEVTSPELPSTEYRLDTLLRLRQPDGTEYLHLVEWQGYRDPNFLWRVLSYLGWLGQNRRERPILVTLVYLNPGDDTGNSIYQTGPGTASWTIALHRVRLWELRASEAVASKLPALATLSPLMAGATTTLAEEAANLLLQATNLPDQDELLTIFGVFAERFIAPGRLERMITKEKLMSSALISHLFADQLAEAEQRVREEIRQEARSRELDLRQELADLNEEVAERDREVAERDRLIAERDRELTHLRQITPLREFIIDLIIARFPDLPVGATRQILRISDMDTLRRLHLALAQAPDQQSAETILAQFAQP